MASIKTRPDGRWRARYRDPRGKEHAGHFATKGAAQGWLDEQTAALVRSEWVDPRRSTLTVGAWSEPWMAGRVHLKPKTVAGYESLLQTRILPTWGAVQLADVTNGDVVAWVARTRRDVSASRTRQATHVLSAMLDAAVRDRRSPSNLSRASSFHAFRRRSVDTSPTDR